MCATHTEFVINGVLTHPSNKIRILLFFSFDNMCQHFHKMTKRQAANADKSSAASMFAVCLFVEKQFDFLILSRLDWKSPLPKGFDLI